MIVGILQPGYLPWLGFFEQLYRTELFIILDDVQYTKKDWRNRNKIRTQDGWMWLTVPVYSKDSFNQLIKDVKINNTLPWQKKHWKSIEYNYHKAPYFELYAPKLKEVYFEMDWENLLELDLYLINLLKDFLGIKTPIILSSSLNTTGKKNEKIINILKAVKATKLYDGESAENFIDKELFIKENIELEFQHYKHPIYNQVYEPFIPYMSVIDLLFNHGDNSLNILLNGEY